MIRRAAAVAALLLAACDRGSTPPSPAPSASPASSGAPAAASAPAAAASAAPAATTARFAGAYTAKPGAVAPPPNAKEKTWQKDPGTASVGPGTMELTVSGPRGEVVGTAGGALGDLVVSGTFDGKELRATAQPKDPNAPNAMTGTMALAEQGGALVGTLRVSGRDATIVREAEVKLERK